MGKFDNLSGHCAIITGASGGIGSEFASQLTKRGCSAILVDIDPERLRTVAARIGKESSRVPYVLVADLSDKDIEEKIDEFCVENDLDPDILINNAGIFSFRPVTDTSTKLIDSFIGVHVGAVTVLSRWFAARRAAKGSGWILNMSSMSCWMPMPGLAMYASTKAYIRVLSRSLHYEMKDFGVGVTVACPGGISTDLFGLPDNLKKLAVAIGVLDTPERFVRKAIDRMLRKKKQYINGWLNRVSIFSVGLTPTPVRMMVKHRLLDKGIIR